MLERAHKKDLQAQNIRPSRSTETIGAAQDFSFFQSPVISVYDRCELFPYLRWVWRFAVDLVRKRLEGKSEEVCIDHKT
eukprot:3561856-Amphidinium_carterae.1